MRKHISLRAKRMYLIRMAGILLLIVCLAKFIAVYSGSKVLSATEDISGISYGKLTTLVAMLEAIIGTAAAFFPNTRFSVYSVAWLGMLFAEYKVIRSLLGFTGPCHCLGSLFAWWPWGNAHENVLAWGVIAILLMSSGVCIYSPYAPSGQKEPVA